MTPIAHLLRLPRIMSDLFRNNRGLALTEFALATPIVMAIGGYGIEFANFALTNMKVNQIALNLADNASRVGLSSPLTETQLRETDINDVLIGARLQGASIGLTTNGRVRISSLENVQQSYDTTSVQRVHWQRCIGQMNAPAYLSSITTATTAGQPTTSATSPNAGTAAPSGMGSPAVNAPQAGGVMYIEIAYRYQPLFGSMFIDNRVITYTASFIVRDKRDFSELFNPTPAVTTANKMTCDRFTTT